MQPFKAKDGWSFGQNYLSNLFKTYANFPLWDYLIFKLQPSVKESMINKKNEEMNKFVNNFMASLTEQEKKLPFLTNHARAWKLSLSRKAV